VHSFTQSHRVFTAPFGVAEAECPLQLGAKSGRNLPGHTGQSLVIMDTLKSPFHLLGACRPLGMSHLLPAHSPALAHSSLPRERTLQSHVLPSAKSHAVERRLRARKLGQFQLSAPAEELPNVSACESSAQIKVPGEAGDWLCQPVLQQTWRSLSAGSCLNKLLERMKLSILQACITLHSG
ncbi:hypothetical protein Nmel_012053, partial [Mimus melanotis]